MNLLRSLFTAFAMYSKFPTPRTEWTASSMAWALCFFPLVGAAIGLFLGLWLMLAHFLGLSTILTAAAALLLPIALSGGIHLDGLCDTADALGSHQSRARMLEILKDSHIGAFGVMACVLYLIVFFAAWCQALPLSGREIWAAALIPVLSRSLSGLGAVTLPNARGSGLLASFTAPMHLAGARVVLALWALAAAAGMIWLAPLAGGAAAAAAVLVFCWYRAMSRRKFGGITGDLAGFFLQLCELGCILALSLAPVIREVAA